MSGTDGRVRQLQAYGAYHQLLNRQRAQAERAAQLEVDFLIREAVAVLAAAMGEAKGDRCGDCGRAKGTRCQKCAWCAEQLATAGRQQLLADEVAAWEHDHPGFAHGHDQAAA